MNVCAYRSRQTYKYVATDPNLAEQLGLVLNFVVGKGGGMLLGHTELKKKKEKCNLTI